MKATFIYAPVNVPVCVRTHTYTYTPNNDFSINYKSYLRTFIFIYN